MTWLQHLGHKNQSTSEDDGYVTSKYADVTERSAANLGEPPGFGGARVQLLDEVLSGHFGSLVWGPMRSKKRRKLPQLRPSPHIPRGLEEDHKAFSFYG